MAGWSQRSANGFGHTAVAKMLQKERFLQRVFVVCDFSRSAKLLLYAARMFLYAVNDRSWGILKFASGVIYKEQGIF
jgi:hypothetical protein